MIQSFARGLACALLQRIESGQLTLVEDGRRTVFGSGSPQATVVVRDPRLWTALRRGGKGLAEAYVDGWWDSPDVTAVVEVAARNLHGDRRAPAPDHARSASRGSGRARCWSATPRCARARTSPPTTTSATTCSG